VSSLSSAFILTLTVVGVVAAGIVMAYATITAILFAVAPRAQNESASRVLVASQAHAGGD
jgi:uncharacterized protein (UPF0333 family)